MIDFDWSNENEWSIASVSDDASNPMKGGGTLNIFRPFEWLIPEANITH